MVDTLVSSVAPPPLMSPGPHRSATSLLLGTLTDLSRSKSELVAENARYASATDHPAAPGEPACVYQDGTDAPGASGQDGTTPGSKRCSLSSQRRSCGGIVRASSSFGSTSPGQLLPTQDIRRDRRLDQGDGKGQSTVGSRTNSW